MPYTDFADALQFLRAPDSSGWIMGITQQHDFHLRVGSLAFEIIVIDRVGIAVETQWRRYGLASVVSDRGKEPCRPATSTL